MSKQDTLQKINNELKVYINESSFISMKCRNRLLKLFEEEFSVDFDISNYQNVDLSIQEDFRILYREDYYESKEEITSLEEVEERYHRFQEKADQLIRRKDVDFQGRRNFNNFLNLLIVLGILLLIVFVIILVIHSLMVGNYFDCLWFLLIIVPAIVPRFKNSIENRFTQAKGYIKSLLKKVK